MTVDIPNVERFNQELGENCAEVQRMLGVALNASAAGHKAGDFEEKILDSDNEPVATISFTIG
jgi:hypothetical protein